MFYGTDYDFGMIHWKITIQKMRGKMMIIYRTWEYSIFREMWIAENTWISVVVHGPLQFTKSGKWANVQIQLGMGQSVKANMVNPKP